jgi:hypothetical protein
VHERSQRQLQQLSKEQGIDIILELRGQMAQMSALFQVQSARIQALEDPLA